MERTNPSERRDNGLSGKGHLRFGSFAVVRGKTSAFPLIATVKADIGEFGSVSVKDITTLNFNVQYYPQKRKLHDPGNGAG